MESIDMLLNELESEILQAKKAAFSQTDVIINKSTACALIMQIRSNLPSEINEAKEVLQKQKEILDEANSYATAVCQKAIDEATKMVTETEVYNRALQQCNEMGSQAEENYKRMDYEARSSAFALLQNVEKTLNDALNIINENKNKLVKN